MTYKKLKQFGKELGFSLFLFPGIPGYPCNRSKKVTVQKCLGEIRNIFFFLSCEVFLIYLVSLIHALCVLTCVYFSYPFKD